MFRRSSEDFPIYQKGSTSKPLLRIFTFPLFYPEKTLITQPPKKDKQWEKFSFFYYYLLFKNSKKEKRYSSSNDASHLPIFQVKLQKILSHLDRYEIIFHNWFSFTLGYCIPCFITKKTSFGKVMNLKILEKRRFKTQYIAHRYICEQPPNISKIKRTNPIIYKLIKEIW